ncbi:MAG: hypothetical protein JSV49_07665, partial [Thermoplasmata archaeon]
FTVQDKLFSEEYLKGGAETGASAARGGGVMEYMKKNYLEVDGDFIKANVGDMTKAMEMILDVLQQVKADESIVESMDLIVLSKLLCFQDGKPTIMDKEDFYKGVPDMEPHRVDDLLDKLAGVGILKKEEQDGKITYQVTEKGDELGEAIFPMVIWAMKWAEKD